MQRIPLVSGTPNVKCHFGQELFCSIFKYFSIIIWRITKTKIGYGNARLSLWTFVILGTIISFSAVIGISQCDAFYVLKAKAENEAENLPASPLTIFDNEMRSGLSIYRNTITASAIPEKNSFVSAKSKRLVALTDMDICSSQLFLRKEPLQSVQFIENLIYANLRIRGLIEQYRQLHEMARKFKSMEWVAALDDTGENNLRFQTSQNRMAQYGIHHVSSELALEAECLIKNPERTKSNRTLRSMETEIADTDFLALNRSRSSQYTTVKNQSVFGLSDPGSGHGYRAEPNNQNPENLHEVYKNRNDGTPPKESELPWIFRFFLSFFEYFMKNKIEGVVYLFMILALISISTGARR